ncbi:sodium channel subunit beta-3 isoform X1 [Hippoglossus stenolepis]|uniref:sodium channel subunit beta-3 isoform X1 n=1 Tax=Hippoglossus stenolepis TaxID=195615 RepID=UPI00159C1A70|nr:sodium channel subunit beta-3 isoform X1 [Hippoglossus stenolepis]
MVTQPRVQLHTLALLLLVVHLGQPVCVEVPSATEAVLGKSMLLTCIFCMKREELKPKTHVNWYYKPTNDIPTVHIYNYEKRMLSPQAGQFKGRLTWKGSYDFQEVSIQIHNVTFNDSGIYECHVTREFKDFIPPSNFMKNITLKVKEKGTDQPTKRHDPVCASMKVSLRADSRGNQTKRPPLCIDCVLWRAIQKMFKCSEISTSFSAHLLLFLFSLMQASESINAAVQKTKLSVSCTSNLKNTNHALFRVASA